MFECNTQIVFGRFAWTVYSSVECWQQATASQQTSFACLPARLPARLPACPPARSSLPPPAPAAGKVVDRHWYNKNKHIYPASRWEAFDEAKQYEKDCDDPLPDLR